MLQAHVGSDIELLISSGASGRLQAYLLSIQAFHDELFMHDFLVKDFGKMQLGSR